MEKRLEDVLDTSSSVICRSRNTGSPLTCSSRLASRKRRERHRCISARGLLSSDVGMGTFVTAPATECI